MIRIVGKKQTLDFHFKIVANTLIIIVVAKTTIIDDK